VEIDKDFYLELLNKINILEKENEDLVIAIKNISQYVMKRDRETNRNSHSHLAQSSTRNPSVQDQ
jgi:hypothetical protein